MKDKGFRASALLARNPVFDTMFYNLKTMFGADLRSLALFRIWFSVAGIFDLLNRYSDLWAHYTDGGVMPRSIVLTNFVSDRWISLHMMSGMYMITAGVFILHGIVNFLMLIGYRTRLMTFLSWCMLISLHNRNILVLHGGDILQRVVLFWAIFLPLGECYSYDAAYRKPRKARSNNRDYMYVSVATFALAAQWAIMYISSYCHKTAPEWRVDATSTWLALQLDFFRTPIGDFMLLFPEALKPLTSAVLWWEGYGPYFWYVPIFSGPVRLFAVIGFMCMHLGFVAALRLGNFGTVSVFGLTALLPTWMWEYIVFRRLRTRERLSFKLFFDPGCKFCTNFAIFCENFLLIPETKVLALTEHDREHLTGDGKRHQLSHKGESRPTHASSGSKADRGRDSDEESSEVIDIIPNRTFTSFGNAPWLLCQDAYGVYHSNFAALVQIFKVSPLLWPLHRLFVSARSLVKYGEIVMRFVHEHDKNAPIAPHRPAVARRKSPWKKIIKRMWRISSFIVVQSIVAFLIWIVLSWNASVIGQHQWATPDRYKWVAWSWHLEQSWAMFSPRPPDVHWSYVIQGEMDNGTEAEFFRGEGLFNWEPNTPFTWDRGPDMWRSFKNHRWFKYYENGLNTHPQNNLLRLNYGRYICREYNARHWGGAMLYKFSIHFISDQVDAKRPDQPRRKLPHQTLWNHLCYEKPGDRRGR
eukprot:TRINITY_DN2673_c0_g2_i1.p1 TRINITY_DN2673_c0_g2~~TRINITY_DN2673_c0_g2_i1.p1  ORF type:complete len:697 (+),score=177.83 TRINITY_DN2673_c0_g2_i1:115-2205(+)